MPTVFRHGPYSFHFYASDRGERPHVHVRDGDRKIKVWLDPVEIARTESRGFRRQEVNRIWRLVVENEERFLEEWNEFFSN